MNRTHNGQLTSNSQKLRKNMTKEERKLWYDFLKKLPVTVNRQKVIGNYIVDFYCADAKLVIELDGAQHYEEQARQQDEIRDEYLRSIGLAVVRYKNLDINRNLDGVCGDIMRQILLRQQQIRDRATSSVSSADSFPSRGSLPRPQSGKSH